MQVVLFRRWKMVYCAVVIGLLMAGSSRAQPELPEPPVASEATAPVQAAQRFTGYVPMTANGVRPSTVFGVEMTAARPDRGLDSVAQLGPAWVRRNGLLWKDVEPIEDRGYSWTAPSVAALESELLAISARGLQPILVVRGYPRWAAQTDCAPINPAKLGKFAAFLTEAVKRYSVAPYNARVWELGNEPDAPVDRADSVYGCWGVPSDPYYGGRRYGEMLRAVYPAIKAANSQVQVMNGGLLIEKPGDPMLKFMEGMLVAGAGNAFDVVSFHSYCMFDPRNPDGHDVLFRSCANDWKLDYLRELTRRYGIPNKPMFRTEAALLCSTVEPTCRQSQANYVARHYARTARDGLLGAIWYILDSDGFNNSALLEPTNPGVARPAWLAMRHAAAMYGGAKYVGRQGGLPAGAEGYVFIREGQTVVIAWSNRVQAANITVAPTATVSCSTRDGQPLACANAGGVVTLSLGASPSYVVAR